MLHVKYNKVFTGSLKKDVVVYTFLKYNMPHNYSVIKCVIVIIIYFSIFKSESL